MLLKGRDEMKAPKEVRGDARASTIAFQEHLMRVGEYMLALDRLKWEATEKRPLVYEFRFKCDPDDARGVLCIVKAYKPEGYVVAFHREEMLWEALVGVSKRLQNNSLNWREDKPYDDDKGRRDGNK